MTDRSDKYTIKTREVERWSDFDASFDLNPQTGYLFKISNEEAIKQSLRNLILTKRGERPYNFYIGSRLHHLLFEPFSTATSISIENEIDETIKNNEPRVNLVGVEVVPKEDINTYHINIFFNIVNIPNKIQELTLNIERVR